MIAKCAALFMGAVFVCGTGLLAAHAQKEKAPVFSHSTQITHPYFPLSSLQNDLYRGKEAGKAVRVTNKRVATKKTFMVGGKKVVPLAFEFREFVEGELKEVAIDYFAQDDAGNVYYLGEEVANYANGKVVGHEGAWLYGKGKAALGVMLPANPKVGDKYQPENVPGVTTEDDEVISTTETVTIPFGTYKNCVKVREKLSDGTVEYKVYAKDVGLVVDNTVRLVSRKTRK